MDGPLRTTATSDGVLLVDKPARLTSHDVVALARRALRTRRIGHAGTLDPFATGLLVLLVGRATRLLPYIQGEPKVYEASICFGEEMNTDDATGTVVRRAGLPEPDAVDDAIRDLTGVIAQRPPDYSAKKVAGRRAYDAARAGAPLELAPVNVTVNEWTVRSRTATTLDVTISCGGGTYVRALARDLGRLAHSAAHLTALRRVRSGVFDVHDARPIEALDTGADLLLPLRAAVPGLPARVLNQEELGRVRHGNPVPAASDDELLTLLDPAGALVAIARRNGSELHPSLVLLDG